MALTPFASHSNKRTFLSRYNYSFLDHYHRQFFLKLVLIILLCFILNIFSEDGRFRLLAQFRGGQFKNQKIRRPYPTTIQLLDPNIRKEKTVTLFNGTCAYLNDFVESDRNTRYCLVPKRGGTYCDLRTITTDQMQQLNLEHKVIRMLGAGWSRTANQLYSVRNLLVIGSNCGKVIISKRQVDGLAAPGAFSCVDFTSMEHTPHQRLEEKSTVQVGDHCLVGDKTYYDLFWKADDDKLMHHQQDHQFIANRLLMAYMGVRMGSYLGEKCDIPDHVAVAHIRSGDVTNTSITVDQWYGQPPFEFYKLVMQHLGDGISTLRVLSEDNMNPVFDALIALEKTNNSNHSFSIKKGNLNESNSSLLGDNLIREDNDLVVESITNMTYQEVVRTIMCAKTIIASRSTMNAFVQASPNLLNFFNMDFRIKGNPFRHTTEYQYQIPESSKPYSVIEKWTNSEEQRHEMLNYSGGILVKKDESMFDFKEKGQERC